MLTQWFVMLMQVHWGSPWALALIPVLIVLWLLASRAVLRPPAGALSTTNGLSNLPRSVRQRFVWLPGALTALGTAGLIVAMARPQIGIGRVETSSEAVAIQLVVDRSGSMNQYMESDGSLQSRIDIVKAVLRGFLLGDGDELSGRPSDLVGLITFARFAETACPLVRDPRTLTQLIQTVETAQARYEDGTAIGDGLALAAARLKRTDDELKNRKLAGVAGEPTIKSKIIVLLTDGDNNAGEADPLEAAKLAAEWGIKVYTIGIGAGSDSFQIMRDVFGKERRVRVPSNVDETTLQRIAEITGGVYHRAQDGEALRRVYAEIDKLEKSTVNTVEYTDWQERFAYPAAIGGLMLAAGLVLGSTWLRRTI